MCYCGDSIVLPNNKLSTSSCNTSCSGSPVYDQACGSSDNISIYITPVYLKTTTIQTTTIPNVVGSFANMSSSQLNEILSNTDGSLTGCLISCSNHGVCTYDPDLNQMSCACDQYYTGTSCQYDTRACSSNPCLNGGNCTNVFKLNTTSFECSCGHVYNGIYCENQVDLCLNSTCVKEQGYCKVSGSMVTCVCLSGYEGLNCDQKSSALKTQKAIVSMASVLAFVIMGLFWFMVFAMDYLKFFVMKDKRVKETSKVK